MGGRLYTDKLVLRWLEGFGVWSLDSATHNILLATIAYPAHASGLSNIEFFSWGTGEQGQKRKVANLIRKSLRKASINDYSA